MPQSQVYAILEDSRGYMWYGTRGGGVGIFDGTEFRTVSEAEGLVNNFITDLKEDENGDIWVGTDAGITVFSSDTIFNYPSSEYFSGHGIRKILLLEGDSALLACSGGLYKWSNGNFSRIKELKGKSLFDVKQDDRGMFWMAAADGLYSYRPGEIKHFKNLTRVGNDETRSVLITDNTLCIGSYGGGLIKYNGTSFTNISKSDGMPAYVVLTMLKDKAGNIWIGTEGGGVLCYDGISFRQFTIEQGLPGNTIRCIYQDSQGNLWFGSSGGGVARFDGEMFVHYKPGGGAVYSIAQDGGKLWLGAAQGGALRFDEDGTDYLRFTNAKVKTIFKDSGQNMVFGTEGDGLYVYNGKRFKHFTRKDGLSSDWIKTIIQDKAGRYYIGTSGGGLNILDGKKLLRLNKKQGLVHSYVNQLCFGPDSSLWIATNGGISRWKDSVFTNYTKKEGLVGDNVKSVCKDFLGNIWFGTVGGGICRIKGSQIENFTTSHGLTSNNLYLLFTADGQFLWAGSEKGIDKITLDANGDIKNIRHYAKKDGFTGLELMQNAAFADSSGFIWFGTVEGLTRYDPRKDNSALHPPRVYLTDVKLFYEPIIPKGKALKQAKWNKLPGDLNLNYGQNHLSFEFAGISLKEGSYLRYRWMLKGFDTEWSPPVKQRNATYSNLPPGDYIFMVEAGNDEDEWSKTPATFSFSIADPFWNTWYFISLLGLLVCLTGAGLFMYSTASIQKKEKQKNRQLELERNLLQLEQQALRLQMNPHFLFNCLNSIKGLVSENKTQEAKLFISRFARLMRSTLENSRESFITLDEEIKALQNYIELEKLSAGDVFQFSVSLEKNVDPSSVMIPPMLVQPFVENSLIHGISSLEKGGMINVSFLLDGNMLKCIITDNGIGRKRAAERDSSEGRHRSSALKIIQDRLNVLSENLNLEQVKILITDMHNEEGAAAGTKVEVMIPFRER